MTYPLDLLRTRLAAQPEPRVYLGLSHAVFSVVRQEGAIITSKTVLVKLYGTTSKVVW